MSVGNPAPTEHPGSAPSASLAVASAPDGSPDVNVAAVSLLPGMTADVRNAASVDHPEEFVPSTSPGLGSTTDMGPDGDDRTNLYVSNISTDVDDDGLKAMFAPFGAILNCRIMVDIHTCKSRGFGFVQFASAAEALAAVKGMDGSVHHSQTLMVRLASRKTRQPGSLTPKIFLRNVPAGVSEDELRRMCSHFGPVTTCAVRPDVQHGVVTDSTTGGVSQVAYVTFAELDAAKKAVLSLNNSRPWPASVNPLLAKVLDSNQKRRTGTEGDTPLGLQPSPGNSYTDTRGGGRSATGSTHGLSTSATSVTAGGLLPGSAVPQVAVAGPMFAFPHHFHHQQQLPLQPGMQQHQMQQSAAAHAQAALFGAPPPMAPAGYPAYPGYPGYAPAGVPGAVPPGYQVVMQPVLQPIYGPPATGSPTPPFPGQAGPVGPFGGSTSGTTNPMMMGSGSHHGSATIAPPQFTGSGHFAGAGPSQNPFI